MSHSIEVVQGPDQGRRFSMTDGKKLSIGRGQASDTQLNDPRMSRVHCIVEIVNNSAKLIDNGSTGGTHVGAKQITTHELRPGDIFMVGDSQLQYHLATDTEASTMMQPAVNRPDDSARPTPKLSELVGQTFGNFRIDEIITMAQSGMLFRASDLKSDASVALKVLTPDMSASEEQKERFVRAMKAMLPIRHPNIVRLYNAGKKGPFCWAAMEFIDGHSLVEVIDRIGIEGMLDWREVWRVAMHIGSALSEAHSQKIIHRNVTPTNIMQRQDKTCLLGDLALAKGLKGNLSHQVTQPGQIVGDLPYLPPERTMVGVDIDGRSDLYGLGATLYALLTGNPPAQGGSMPEIVQNVRGQIPEPPKTFQLSVNELFADTVMRLLAKNPGDRYQSAAALLKELSRIGKFNNMEE